MSSLAVLMAKAEASGPDLDANQGGFLQSSRL